MKSSLFSNPLQHLTKDKDEQRNVLLLGSKNVLRNAAINFYAGEVSNTFNAMIGITPAMLAWMALPFRLVHLALMLVSSVVVDRIKRRTLTYAILTFCTGIGAVGGLIASWGPPAFRTIGFYTCIYVFFSVLNAILSSFYGPVDSIIECRTVHNDIRGRFWSVAGMVSGVFGIFFSFIASVILKRFGMPYGFGICFATGILLLGICSILVYHLRELKDLETVQPKKRLSPFKSFAETVRMRQFRIMMPGNILRGMGDGCTAYIMLLAVKRMNLPAEYAGYAGMIASASIFVSYVIMAFTLDRFGVGLVLLIADTLLVVGLMGTAVTMNPLLFLACFLLLRVMANIEATAVPLVHYEVVPREVMGAFSSVRLFLLTITTNVAGTVVGFCLGLLSPVLVFAGSAIMKLAAGAFFCYGVYSVKRVQQ